MLSLESRYTRLDEEQMMYANAITSLSNLCTVCGHYPKPKKMSKVLPHLYLGSYHDATDVSELKEQGITHVLNTVENAHQDLQHTGAEYYGDTISYHGFTSHDEEGYPIMHHFEESMQFIERARESGGKCLMHCRGGVNRSGVLVTAYVMVHQDIGPVSAARMVSEARGVSILNESFVEMLVELALDKDLLSKDANQIGNVANLLLADFLKVCHR